jgi:hypothetical protein
MTNASSCPSEFTLERWRFGELAASPEEAPLIAHIEACPGCRQRHAELAAAELPSGSSEPIWSRALAAGKVDGLSPKKLWRSPSQRWVAPALAGVALAAAVFVAIRRPEPDTLTKGGDWQIGVIAKTREGSLLRIDPGAPLVPGDRLRFEVFTNWPKADIALVMLDSAGNVSQLAPTGARSLSISGGRRVVLDDAVELDGTLGPERIVLVACARPLQVLEAVASARLALATAHGDPRRVDTLGTGCHEETFWITKVNR